MYPDIAKCPLGEINLPKVRTTGIPNHGTSERSLHCWAWAFIQKVEAEASKCLWLWWSWFIQVYWASPHHHALHCAVGSGDMGRSPVPAPQVAGETSTSPAIAQQQAAACMPNPEHSCTAVQHNATPGPWTVWVWSLGGKDPLEEGMPIHSSILAWRVPGTEEAGRLQSQGVGHDWSNLARMHTPLTGGHAGISQDIYGASMVPNPNF